MTKHRKSHDLNVLAHSVVTQATGEPEEPLSQADLSKLASLLGRRGGLKGGKARAAALTPEQRSAIAKKAVEVRWKKKKT